MNYLTEEQFNLILGQVVHRRRLKKYKNSEIAIYKHSIEHVLGNLDFKIYLIGALRRNLTYEETIAYIQAKML